MIPLLPKQALIVADAGFVGYDIIRALLDAKRFFADHGDPALADDDVAPADSDGDGLSDAEEEALGLDPQDPDFDTKEQAQKLAGERRRRCSAAGPGGF